MQNKSHICPHFSSYDQQQKEVQLHLFICQEVWRKYGADQSFQNSNSRLIIKKEGSDGILTFISAKNRVEEQICNI